MLPYPKKPAEQKKAHRHWPLYLVAVFFILADLLVGSYLCLEKYFQNRIYPGVRIGTIALGGKTADEAKGILETKVNDLNQNGIQFYFDQNVATITPIISSFNGDLAYQVITFNVEETVNRALAVGHRKGFVVNFENQFFSLISGHPIAASYSSDTEQIKKMLSSSFAQFAAPAQDARLFATTTDLLGEKELSFEVASEKIGYQLDYDQALLDLKADLQRFDNAPIHISSAKGFPSLSRQDIQPLAATAQKFIDKTSLTLAYADKKWPVTEDQLASWLTVSRTSDNKLSLDLDKNLINDYLEQKAAPQIEVPPADARFQIQDGRVVQFSNSQNGVKIDLDQTYLNLKNAFLAGGNNTVAIALATVTSEIAAKETNNLGITEIVGTGHSNFANSPKNRIKNIQIGAASLNGLLIPPGTEFSTDKALGTVDASTGYLPEMSIMGDKTIAEFGGGLCQIGTTLFRAALASGFPITARQAHSYRVVYYEPAGTDATIYQPWPDLRFINDSPNYILIQTHISGNDLYFDFWGTKDGRVVEESDPTIYNIVKPPATKYTETLDLPPGVKKCTERAHNGADAFFDYKVTYPNGTVMQKRFTSHYVPWREVCLIGVAQLSASSTPAQTP